MKYFAGRKELDRFFLTLDNGRTNIYGTIFERWIDIQTSSTARCGANCKIELTKRFGITKTNINSLTGSLAGTIGPEAFAQIKSKIETTISNEVSWETHEEKTQTFEFASPKCGTRTDTVYQYVREYELAFESQSRWRGRIQRDVTLTEYTKNYDALTDIEQFDEACRCKRPVDRRSPDGLGRFDFGMVSVRSAYHLVNDPISPAAIEIYAADRLARFRRSDEAHETRSLGYLPMAAISSFPPYVAFLQDSGAEDADVEVSEYFNEQIASPVTAEARSAALVGYPMRAGLEENREERPVEDQSSSEAEA